MKHEILRRLVLTLVLPFLISACVAPAEVPPPTQVSASPTTPGTSPQPVPTQAPGTPPPQVYNVDTNAGDSARDYLSNSKYKKLVVELQSVEGFAPAADAVRNLETFLKARLYKDEIRFVHTKLPNPGKTHLDISEIRKLEDRYRTVYPDLRSGTMAMYFMFLNNEAAESKGGESVILGVAYHNTSLAIYGGSISRFSGGVLQPSTGTLQTAIIQHEVGHVLGLVGIGSPIQSEHDDKGHWPHCNNTKCLMHWAVDTSNVVQNLLGGVPELDANCLQDLKANGGR